jgi:hypothetical protein
MWLVSWGNLWAKFRCKWCVTSMNGKNCWNIVDTIYLCYHLKKWGTWSTKWHIMKQLQTNAINIALFSNADGYMTCKYAVGQIAQLYTNPVLTIRAKGPKKSHQRRWWLTYPSIKNHLLVMEPPKSKGSLRKFWLFAGDKFVAQLNHAVAWVPTTWFI